MDSLSLNAIPGAKEIGAGTIRSDSFSEDKDTKRDKLTLLISQASPPLRFPPSLLKYLES